MEEEDSEDKEMADKVGVGDLREVRSLGITIRRSEFTCGEVKELLDDLGVIAKYTTRAHPQANAPVERRHSTITNLLAKWTAGKPNLWPKFLRTVFFVENITFKRTTGYAPATLWYGRHVTFPIESFLKTWRRQGIENDMPLEDSELLDIRARQAYPLEVQRQKRKQLLREQRLWIGKRGEGMGRKAQKENGGDDISPPRDGGEARALGGDGSMRKGKTRKEERSEKEVEGSDMTRKVKKGSGKMKEGKEKGKNDEKIEEAGLSGTAEVPTSDEPLREQSSRKLIEEERQRREEDNKEWRNQVVASLNEKELPSDAP
ncbi:hypothetical protein CBR_g5692 [Chara braunii]|uniref:Integrase catalytic domain-containing protein n=1 Tax=Chara braunii TaxID=69332 RepID=A0A388JRU0_CHABU|nr:hypothetical protein CBR_g5692 [Chara braunii]|eukprot:GBG60516.1 hypothetical protein CBR_g5692 [Chara braunii]